jgi:hypothetical protein
VRLSTDFPEGAPFTIFHGPFPRSRQPQVSTRAFDRFENGDRAIDPLYPSFFTNVGALQVITGPTYSELEKALNDALRENAQRQPLARALMQSDAWAAYDVLYRTHHGGRDDTAKFRERKGQLLSLLARFIGRLALTREEINVLPP